MSDETLDHTRARARAVLNRHPDATAPELLGALMLDPTNEANGALVEELTGGALGNNHDHDHDHDHNDDTEQQPLVADGGRAPEPVVGEDGEVVAYRCPICDTQRFTEARAAKCCAASAERDETPRVDPGSSPSQNAPPAIDVADADERSAYYHQLGIEDVATALGHLTIEGLPVAQCLGNHDFYGWYQTRPLSDPDPDADANEFDAEGSVYPLADDYSKLAAEIDRVLYATTNYQDPDCLDWRPFTHSEDGKEWAADTTPTPGYEDILGFSILADIDLADEYKERPLPTGTRETVERAIGEYTDAFAELTGDGAHVYALDSVGGAYILTPPTATAPIARAFDGEDRKRVFEELRQRADGWLNHVRDDVNATVTDAQGVFEADLLNQKNRLYKAPLSIHSSIDGVVHPLDLDATGDDPAYEFVPVEDVSRDLIDETTIWATEFTHPRHTEAVEHIVAGLWPDYADEHDGWQDALTAWLADARASEREQRKRAQKAAEERARRAEERDGDLPPFTDAVADEDSDVGIATSFDDVQAAVDAVDSQPVVRALCDDYDTDPGRDPPRFEPGYRDSKSGTSCYVDSEKVHDLNDTHAGIGVLDYVAREKGYIGATATATGEARAKARADLRNMGFDIPVYTPAKGSQTHDGEEFEEMPFWAMRKAAVVLGTLPADAFVTKTGDDGGEYPGFPGVETYNNALDAIEAAGIDHGRDRAGATWDDLPIYNDKGKIHKRKTRRAAADILFNNHEFATPRPESVNVEKTPLHRYWPDGGFFERGGAAWVHSRCAEKAPYLETSDMNEIVNRVKRRSYIDRAEFDAGGFDATLINLDNGVYDLGNRTLIDHSPEYLFRTTIPRTYDPDADCPAITEFIEDVVPGEHERRTLFEWIGFCLETDYPIHRFLILHGGGRNGKSVYYRLVRAFLQPNNASGVTLDTLASGGFGVGSLDGNLINIDTESADTRLGPSELNTIKALTGGDQRQVDVKYEEPYEMTNTAKLAFAANNPPRFQEATDAVADRLLAIEFPHRFANDENADKEPVPEAQLMDSLTTKSELSGLLNKALDGLQRVRERGYFSIEENSTSRERFNDYMADADSIFGFAHRCLKNEQGFALPKDAVYNAYTSYCDDHEHVPTDNAAFFRQLGRKTDIETHSKRPRINSSGSNSGERTPVLDHLWLTAEGIGTLSHAAREDTLKTIRHMHSGNGDYVEDLLLRNDDEAAAGDAPNPTPKPTQAGRIEFVKDAIRELCEHDNGSEHARVADIVNKGLDAGIEERQTSHALDKLVKKNVVYQPLTGQYRINR